MDRTKQVGLVAKEFAHENKDMFVIILDPKSDCLFAGYNDSFSFGKIKGAGSRKQNIVKQVLAFSKFNKSLTSFETFKFLADMIISSLAEFLWLPLNRGNVNQFYQFVSDALFYLPKGSKYKVEEPKEEVKVTLDEVLNNVK